MPKKIQDFARESLIKPVLVNVGRAGAANLDVLQVVEYVKQEAKMVYLLECLQKTPPPVIIFSENKNEVDGACYPRQHSVSLKAYSIDIQEYLLLKGVEAVAIHGSKSSFFIRLCHSLSDSQLLQSSRRTSIRHQVLQVWSEGCDGRIWRCIERS